MEFDLLIENGLLLTMENDPDLIKNASVLIKNGVIEAFGEKGQFESVQVKQKIDASSKIIMPGLINAHTHLPMSMFRGLADDLPLDVWLNDHIFPAEISQVNPDSVEKFSKLSIKECLLSGATTICDGYFYEHHVAQAVHNSGIRAVLGHGVIDFPAPGVPDPGKNIDTAKGFVQEWKHKSHLIMPSIFCHAPYTCSKNTLVHAKETANSLGVLFQIHVAETKNEIHKIPELNGNSIVEYLDSIGLLDENTLLVHSVWVSDNDLTIIGKRNSKVVHCPESNMKLASGIAPVPKMIDSNIVVGLGTDGCASNNDLDLFSEMDMAAKLHKVALLDPCIMDARTTLEMATIKGAEAIGLGKITGSIKKGKKADIILIDTNKCHLTPLFNPYSALVYSAKSSDVDLVMVDGKILVENGRLL
ncbi:MAG: amidohydrolase [Desulfobacteraceae bacterium]|nr:amidohydrolase [Desulfobacteraceae bacterium]